MYSHPLMPLFGYSAGSCIQCAKGRIAVEDRDTDLVCDLLERAVPWGYRCEAFEGSADSRPAQMWALLFPNSPAAEHPVNFDAFTRALELLDALTTGLAAGATRNERSEAATRPAQPGALPPCTNRGGKSPAQANRNEAEESLNG